MVKDKKLTKRQKDIFTREEKLEIFKMMESEFNL